MQEAKREGRTQGSAFALRGRGFARIGRHCEPFGRPVKAYSAGGSALSADFRCFSVADLSCPQAAMMSSPRGVRIGEA